jgi:hypothetical protein
MMFGFLFGELDRSEPAMSAYQSYIHSQKVLTVKLRLAFEEEMNRTAIKLLGNVECWAS